MSKRILVLCGHTDTETYTGAVADAYHGAAEEAGHQVSRLNLGDMHFDPILHKGYKEIQELEPDLLHAQEQIRWAEHVVIVYPNWWCTMPAKLKGFFDRSWLPGFAFNFNKNTKRIEKHLENKTARVIVLSGSHSPFRTWWRFGDYTNEIQYGILEFAGIRTAVSTYGPCEKVDHTCRGKWLEQIKKLGIKGQ